MSATFNDLIRPVPKRWVPGLVLILLATIVMKAYLFWTAHYPFGFFGLLLVISTVFFAAYYFSPCQPGRDSRARNPGAVGLSHEKLKVFHPELYSLRKWMPQVFTTYSAHRDCPEHLRRSVWRNHFAHHLKHGDSQPAVCLTTSPQVLVAAYSSDIDCVALLVFPDEFTQRYSLHAGKRLISVNTYQSIVFGYEGDLSPGPRCSGLWGNFTPLIADFLTDDVARLDQRKREITGATWNYVEALGHLYMKNRTRARSGAPMRSSQADTEWLFPTSVM